LRTLFWKLFGIWHMDSQINRWTGGRSDRHNYTQCTPFGVKLGNRYCHTLQMNRQCFPQSWQEGCWEPNTYIWPQQRTWCISATNYQLKKIGQGRRVALGTLLVAFFGGTSFNAWIPGALNTRSSPTQKLKPHNLPAHNMTPVHLQHTGRPTERALHQTKYNTLMQITFLCRHTTLTTS